MKTRRRIQTVRYDIKAMRRDQAARGWNDTKLALAAGRSQPTIGRFFSGEHQTKGTAKAIADALGHPVADYIVSVQEQVA